MSLQNKSPELSKTTGEGKFEPQPPYGPKENANAAKTRGARMIETAMPDSENLKSEDIDIKYQPAPFTKEKLAEKSKGYPEIKVDKNTNDIVEALEAIFKKNRKGGAMDHGDTQAGIWEDKHEYVLLNDQTNKPSTRLFKSKDKKA